MTIQRTECGTAVEDAVRALRTGEQQSGGHSWGIAVPTDDGLRIEHGLGTIPDGVPERFADVEATVALGHTRYATKGSRTLENAHPFAIRDGDGEGDVVAALAHNGTWYGAPSGTDRADSYYIARLVETMYNNGTPMETAVQRAGEITGETLAVLDRDGEGYVYAGRYTITEGENCAASSGEIPIPEGALRCV